MLTRQNQGIREMIEDAEKGTLLPPDEFLVGIDERVVGDLLAAGLPVERPLGKHFIVRLESATVRFRDKYGQVVVDGVMFRPATPERRTAVRVHGGLSEVQLDPKSGRLQMKIAIDDLELREAGILEQVLGSGGRKFVAEKGKDLLKDALPVLQIPVALAQTVRVPAITEGAVQMDSLTVPLDMAVTKVIAAGGKFWVFFAANVGEIQGAEGGLGVQVGKKKAAR